MGDFYEIYQLPPKNAVKEADVILYIHSHAEMRQSDSGSGELDNSPLGGENFH
jgi:hypothetical protein